MERRVFGLDLLRAIAILSVVTAHGVPFLYAHFPRASWLGHLGSFGVDLFFVLSGFLIGGIVLRIGEQLAEPAGLVGFWLRRGLRTLPNYFVFLLLNIVLGVWLYDRPPEYWNGVAACATFTQNLAWPPWLGFFPESWTLAIEEWFYLSVPLAAAVLLRSGFSFRTAMCCVLAGILIVPMLLRMAAPADALWAEGVRMPVVHRLDSLGFGVLAAWLDQSFPRVWVRWKTPAAVAGVLLCVSAYVLMYRLDLDRSWYARTLLFSHFNLGFALLMPWASCWKSESQSPLARAVRAVALWSYSIYLCNWSFHVLGMRFFGTAAASSLPVALGTLAGYVSASLAFAALAYHGWERRLTGLRDRFPWARGAARPAA